jgi:putative Holliday junction resolvase
MTRILALDIGKRRTGVAFYDEESGVPLPLDTITHTSREELLRNIGELVRTRKIDRIVMGLPLLPSGKEGTEATFVRSIADVLTEEGVEITLLDERYSNTREKGGDRDAFAAWNLLQTAISMKKGKH